MACEQAGAPQGTAAGAGPALEGQWGHLTWLCWPRTSWQDRHRSTAQQQQQQQKPVRQQVGLLLIPTPYGLRAHRRGLHALQVCVLWGSLLLEPCGQQAPVQADLSG